MFRLCYTVIQRQLCFPGNNITLSTNTTSEIHSQQSRLHWILLLNRGGRCSRNESGLRRDNLMNV